jgi:hypothetical protein
MFTYAFAKILSKVKHCGLYGEPLPNFKNTSIDILPTIIPDSNAIRTSSSGNQVVNIEQLFRMNNDIVVDSFLQKYLYYSGNRNILKYLFNIDKVYNDIPDNDELVIHVRETDYIALNMVLDVNIYLNAIKDLKYVKNTIVTDNCNSNIVKQLQDTGCHIYSNEPVTKFSYSSNDNMMRDYIYMLNAKHLLISHSSFAWWPAFLGEHEHVYCPVTDKKTMWLKNPGKDDPDLIMNNFIKLEY